MGLSDDALLALARAGGGGSRTGHLAAALDEGAASDLIVGSLTESERARAVEFAGLLRELRALKGRMSTRDLLERALERTGLPEASLLRSGSARGFGNLAKLLSIVSELEADPAMNLDEVVFALEDLRASAAREGEVSLAGGDEDAVQLLTVHAAKGLEWPLVVVADLGRSEIPWPEPVAWSAQTGCVPVLADPTNPFGRIEPGAYARLFEQRKTRDREESKRLLYVAMTRARDHLVLAGSRGGTRDAGPWLAWALRPLNLAAAPIRVEEDEVESARILAGPDVNGVRVVHVGKVPVEDGDEEPAKPANVLAGPLGPEAGARTHLDEPTRERIRQGLPPHFALEESDRVAAAQVLACAERPLPEADLGASLYVVTEVLAYESCPRLYLYEQVLGAKGETISRSELASAAGQSLDSLVADEPRSAGDEVSAEEAPVTRDAEDRLDDPTRLPRHILGTATHRALELGSERTSARVREIVAEETDGALSPAGLSAAVRLVMEWVNRFERSPLGRRTARADEVPGGRGGRSSPKQVLREEPFLVQLEGILLRGTADLVFRDGQGSVLVDYKTNEVTPLEVPAKARSYALQLQLYALAVGAWLGEPVREAWLSFLAADQSVSVDVSEAALEEARERLRAFVAARRRGEFPPRPGSLCRTCAFRAVCPGALAAVATPLVAREEVLTGT